MLAAHDVAYLGRESNPLVAPVRTGALYPVSDRGMARHPGIEPGPPRLEDAAAHPARAATLVRRQGLEPMLHGLKVRCITIHARGA